GDFAAMVGISKHTLYAWKKKFDSQGPAGLMDHPRGRAPGSRLPDLTRRTILMLKQANPEWGCERISDMLVRGPELPASPTTVARVLKEAGYELVEQPTTPHPDKVRHFERATANQLWQTDLFTFILKRQNRRVYLVAFMDDHSRFLVGFGLHASLFKFVTPYPRRGRPLVCRFVLAEWCDAQSDCRLVGSSRSGASRPRSGRIWST